MFNVKASVHFSSEKLFSAIFGGHLIFLHTKTNLSFAVFLQCENNCLSLRMQHCNICLTFPLDMS